MTDTIKVKINDYLIKLDSIKTKECFNDFKKKKYFSEYNNIYTSNIDIFTEKKKVKNGCYYQLYIENNAEKITSKLIRGFDANPTNNRKVGKSPVLIEPDPKGKNVVIILESPHRDEYDFKDNQDKSTLTPIAPANGKTGGNIRDHIFKIISKRLKLNEGIYNIYLLNRVPYQCSLGSLYKTGLNNEIRNKIFKELWSKNQNEFFKELQSFSPDIIIESCTQAVDGIDVTDKFSNQYLEYIDNIYNVMEWDTYTEQEILYCSHPSVSWGTEHYFSTEKKKHVFLYLLFKTHVDEIKNNEEYFKEMFEKSFGKKNSRVTNIIKKAKTMNFYNSTDLYEKLEEIGWIPKTKKAQDTLKETI